MNSKLGYSIYSAILAQGFINLFIIHGLEFDYSKIKISYFIIQSLKIALFFIETEQTSYNYVLTIITGLWWVLGFLVRLFLIIRTIFRQVDVQSNSNAPIGDEGYRKKGDNTFSSLVENTWAYVFSRNGSDVIWKPTRPDPLEEDLGKLLNAQPLKNLK